jgi:hypothetical protein
MAWRDRVGLVTGMTIRVLVADDGIAGALCGTLEQDR